jgi:hypothetical protein
MALSTIEKVRGVLRSGEPPVVGRLVAEDPAGEEKRSRGRPVQPTPEVKPPAKKGK